MKNIRIPGGVVLCGAGLFDGIGVGFLVLSFLKGFDLSMLWNVSEHCFPVDVCCNLWEICAKGRAYSGSWFPLSIDNTAFLRLFENGVRKRV